jgi:hypothetical protein
MQRPLPDNTQHSQETATPSAGFEPAIPISERPQTHASDRAATDIDWYLFITLLKSQIKLEFVNYCKFEIPRIGKQEKNPITETRYSL